MSKVSRLTAIFMMKDAGYVPTDIVKDLRTIERPCGDYNEVDVEKLIEDNDNYKPPEGLIHMPRKP